jgi:hypothetical protein
MCFLAAITILLGITPVSAQEGAQPLPPPPVFLNVHGEYLDVAETGQQIMIMKIIENHQRFEQPFVALLEIRDSNNTSQYIAWQIGILPASNDDTIGEATIGYSWSTNAPSTYQARVYVIDSFDHPNVLEPVAENEIVVTDSN